jgi:DNA-binding CsgD family transcriptional regulator
LIERKLRMTGIFIGSIFLVGGLVILILGLARGHSLIACLTNASVLSCTAIAGLLFVSARWPKLFWIQPAVYLALTPIPLMDTPSSFYGLGFFICAIALLFRLGFFQTHGIPKLAACILYLSAAEAFAMLSAHRHIYEAIPAIFFIFAFLVFFYYMFEEKLMVFLTEPKIKLSLATKGLSDTESDYVLAIISGKSVKETAFTAGVSESTVRNILARGYKKLGVSSRSGLIALAEKYEISA